MKRPGKLVEVAPKRIWTTIMLPSLEIPIRYKPSVET